MTEISERRYPCGDLAVFIPDPESICVDCGVEAKHHAGWKEATN